MKLLVVGAQGQVARSLIEVANKRHISLVSLGRPELDLTRPETIKYWVKKAAPDFVVNAAAYTAVDNAENDEAAAKALNHIGAGVLAGICSDHNIPIIHLSTDYVFDGSKTGPYSETDPTSPLGVYGQSKLDGELAVATENSKHIILRTAWVFSPFGNNFVKTMLRLAKTRDELSVVDDQFGCPTYAPHLAGGIIQIVETLTKSQQDDGLWGIYNMAGNGKTTWCGFAREIFANSLKYDKKEIKVVPILTEDFPTPARRPVNSTLDCGKLEKSFGVFLPDWKTGAADCVKRLLKTTERTLS